MSVASAILTSALTSAVVTAVVAALLKHVFDRRFLRVEKELARVYESILESDKQRRETFKIIAGQVYRVRNSAKDIAERSSVHRELLTKLRRDVGKLEEDLYEFRLILEVEEVFLPVHAFKNEARAFIGITRDLLASQTRLRNKHRQNLVLRVSQSYRKLDEQYQGIVQWLAEHSIPAGGFEPSRAR